MQILKVHGGFEGSFQSFTSEKEMVLAMVNETSKAVGLLFPVEARRQNLNYTMRWPSAIDMNTKSIFVDSSQPRNVNGFTDGEVKYLWPLMYAIFEGHLNFFNVSIAFLRSLDRRVSPEMGGKIVQELATGNHSSTKSCAISAHMEGPALAATVADAEL